MDKRFWAVIGIIVVIFGAIFYINTKNNTDEAAKASAKLTNHVQGPANAKATLVEYGDYECPVCGAYYPVLKAVQQQYVGKLKFQFRNFPLTSVHQNALAGARAAEAADKQGKFWEMHDTLYEDQQSWSQATNPAPYFTAYAQKLGLNTDQFKKDFASPAVNATVNADLDEATKLKLNATPSLFLNGRQLNLSEVTDAKTNRPSPEKFSQLIDPLVK